MRKDYYKFDATEELALQPTLQFLNTLDEFAKIVSGEIEWTDAPNFMHYFNMQGEDA